MHIHIYVVYAHAYIYMESQQEHRNENSHECLKRQPPCRLGKMQPRHLPQPLGPITATVPGISQASHASRTLGTLHEFRELWPGYLDSMVQVSLMVPTGDVWAQILTRCHSTNHRGHGSEEFASGSCKGAWRHGLTPAVPQNGILPPFGLA